MDVIRAEQPIIRAARFSFWLAVAGLTLPATTVLVGVSWLLLNTMNSARIDEVKEQVTTLQTQMQGQAHEIETLEKRVANFQATEVRYLEIIDEYVQLKTAAMESKLATQPASVILSGDPSNATYNKIAGVFASSGWAVEAESQIPLWAEAFVKTHQSPASIVLSIPHNAAGELVRAAFDEAAIPYAVREDAQSSTPQIWITAPADERAILDGPQKLPQSGLESPGSSDSPFFPKVQ